MTNDSSENNRYCSSTSKMFSEESTTCMPGELVFASNLVCLWEFFEICRILDGGSKFIVQVLIVQLVHV
jgi:hypothetical protein